MMKKFSINLLVSKLYDTIKWDEVPGEPETDALMRSQVLNRLQLSGFEPVIDVGKKRLRYHLSGSKVINANLRSVIYRTVARYSSIQEFQVFFDLYANASSSSERNRVGSAMGSTTNPEVIKTSPGLVTQHQQRSWTGCTVDHFCSFLPFRSRKKLGLGIFQEECKAVL